MQLATVSRADRQAVSDAWGEWIASMGEWHVFGGLTYDQRRRAPRVPGPQRMTDWSAPKRVSRSGPGRLGAEQAWHHVYHWLSHVELGGERQVEAAVVALEYQRNGWPHFHPLLRLAGGLQPGDVTRLGQSWFGRHGYAKLEAPRDVGDVAAYAAKYLSKDLGRGDVIFWPRRGGLSSHQLAL